MLVAQQLHAWFGPGGKAAARADILGSFAAGLRLRGTIAPSQALVLAEKGFASDVEGTTGDDVVRHPIANPLTARPPRVGGLETDRSHHVSPFPIVISTASRVTEVLLLQVYHLVHERRERVRRRALNDMLRVEGDLVSCALIGSVLESSMGEVAQGIRLALQRH